MIYQNNKYYRQIINMIKGFLFIYLFLSFVYICLIYIFFLICNVIRKVISYQLKTLTHWLHLMSKLCFIIFIFSSIWIWSCFVLMPNFLLMNNLFNSSNDLNYFWFVNIEYKYYIKSFLAIFLFYIFSKLLLFLIYWYYIFGLGSSCVQR